MRSSSAPPLPARRQKALRRYRGGRGRVAGLAAGAAGLADLAFATVLATGLAARSVRPDVWAVPQASALALPAAAVLSLPVAGLWVALTLSSPRRRRSAAWWTGCALHAGLAALAIGRLASPGPAAPALGDTLTLLSLNGGGASEGSPARLAQLLATETPDAVALQETTLMWRPMSAPDEPLQLALANHPIAGPLLGSDQYAIVAPPDTIPAVLLLPAFARTGIRTGPAPPKDITLGAEGDAFAGAYTRSVLRWRGRRIALYNVHLRSFGEERPWQTDQPWSLPAWRAAAASFRTSLTLRAAESERLRAVLDAERLPFLVAGDFNSTPDQWAYAHIAGGLSDALSLHGGGWLRATYPSGTPLVRIDAVLASPEWTVEDAWVGPDGLSDHRPVLARLRLRDLSAGPPAPAVMLPAPDAPPDAP